MVELRDERLRCAVPELEMPRDEPDRLELFEKPQFGEHLERGGMGRRGARAVIDLALRLEERNPHVLSCKRDRRDDAHRARAYDADPRRDRKSTRLNSSHQIISYAVFCLK